MKEFKYNLGDTVTLVTSAETGTVIGRAEYAEAHDSYYVRYKAADGRQTECWWSVDALQSGNAAA